MEAPDIFEFRTTWNNEFFSKTRSTRSAAKRLVRKSVAIEKARRSRRQKLIEEDLVLRLETTEKDRQLLTDYCRSSSVAEHLQRRLENLKDEMKIHRQQMKTMMQKEKDYWKQLEQTIAKRTNVVRSN